MLQYNSEHARLDRQDPLIGILEYRSTPLDIVYSPAELLQGRLLRSVIPILPQQLEPKFIDHSVVRSKLESKRAHEKKYYDKAVKTLSPLELEQGIQIQQKDKTWRPGTVLTWVGDGSFVVNSQGGLYRRNRQQLIHRSAKFQSFDPSSESPTGDIQITRNNTGRPRKNLRKTLGKLREDFGKSSKSILKAHWADVCGSHSEGLEKAVQGMCGRETEGSESGARKT
ncbi:Hypothetical predicted protein [Paramuricea clavata]|uniref:Uncharacterized protein n=1 Tax=Paramuricea clavata TaxID=317549 RepID=A0A6S7JZY5_PARCT|nr:Hypothetical predicted protein [Paramuricea clavata]